MNRTCARCEKPVYPTEELKCLDKTWHKTCFKCQTCGMALNMRTYKGFDKLPYCEAHIPKAKATTVVETPEMRRLAENTKLQSQVQYHADFEKAKGKFTQVADDPETLRIKANTKIISNVAYHGELEKKAAMEQKRSLAGMEENGHGQDSGSAKAASPEPVAAQSPPPSYPQQQQLGPRGGHDVGPALSRNAPNVDSPYSARQSAQAAVVYSSQPAAYANQGESRRIGSISDYDPVNDYHGSVGQAYRPVQPLQQVRVQQQQQQAPQQQQQYAAAQARQQQQLLQQQQQQLMQQRQYQQQQQQQQQQERLLLQQQQQERLLLQQQQQQQQLRYQQQQQLHSSAGVSSGYHPAAPQQQQQQQQRPSGRAFRAMYDYDAQDDDEVSFRDGDLIANCRPIDEGWMTGTVQRTGKSGMVPANYLEPAN